MKKVLNLIVIVALLISMLVFLTACGAKPETKKEDENKNQVADSNIPQEIEEEDGYDESITYENEFEEAVLKRTRKNNDYKIVEISGSKYHGYLTVIYEPSRLHVTATSQVGKTGEWLVDMKEAKNALFAVNGGGFADANFESNGGTPLGVTIANGKQITGDKYSGSYKVVGFNNENKLVVQKYSAEEAKSNGIRDCVTFGPALIENGKAVKDLGSSARGRAARTAIAQRADGIVLFLVLDGDRTKGEGAVYEELIEILQKYGAVTAANLDGGTSTCMTVNGKLVNDPTSMNGEHRTRELATAFYLTKDDSDNSDHSVVQSKLK